MEKNPTDTCQSDCSCLFSSCGLRITHPSSLWLALDTDLLFENEFGSSLALLGGKWSLSNSHSFLLSSFGEIFIWDHGVFVVANFLQNVFLKPCWKSLSGLFVYSSFHLFVLLFPKALWDVLLSYALGHSCLWVPISPCPLVPRDQERLQQGGCCASGGSRRKALCPSSSFSLFLSLLFPPETKRMQRHCLNFPRFPHPPPDIHSFHRITQTFLVPTAFWVKPCLLSPPPKIKQKQKQASVWSSHLY